MNLKHSIYEILIIKSNKFGEIIDQIDMIGNNHETEMPSLLISVYETRLACPTFPHRFARRAITKSPRASLTWAKHRYSSESKPVTRLKRSPPLKRTRGGAKSLRTVTYLHVLNVLVHLHVQLVSKSSISINNYNKSDTIHVYTLLGQIGIE